MSQFVVLGLVKGKVNSEPMLELRAILPQTVLMQPLHFAIGDIIAVKVDDVAGRVELQRRVLGASKGAQCLDIAHPFALAMEITNDDSSGYAVAAAGIKAYYDKIDLLKVSVQLMRWGVDPAIAQALHRLHMCPRVQLRLRSGD
jgi:hypothetical protein